MKRCPRCNTWKEETEFGKDKHTKDGLKCWCKKCKVATTKDYSKTANGIASKKKYNQSEYGRNKIRQQIRKFQKTDKAKIIKQKYYQSEKGQKTIKRAFEYAKKSGKLYARKAVNDAVYNGKIPPAKELTCYLRDDTCSKKMDYHHYKGYEPENYFNIVPLCRSHHYRVDNNLMILVMPIPPLLR